MAMYYGTTKQPIIILNERKPQQNKCWKYIKEFCNMTTLHGFRYLVEEKRSACERIFWLFAMIIAYFVSGIISYAIAERWRSYPIVTTIQPTGLPIWEIPFPAITICSDNQIKPHVFNFTNATTHYQNLTYIESQKSAIAELFCDSYFADEEFINLTIFDSFINEAAVKQNDIIEISTRMPNLNDTVDHMYVATLLSRRGICYTVNLVPITHIIKEKYYRVLQKINVRKINEEPNGAVWNIDEGYPDNAGENFYPWRIFAEGIAGTIEIILKHNVSHYDDACNRGSKGFSVIVHNPAEFPATHAGNSKHLESGKMGVINVIPENHVIDHTLTNWPPQDRRCYFHNEKKLEFFKLYTQHNCDIECKAKHALQYCGCVSFSHPRNLTTPICGPQKIACLHRSYRKSKEIVINGKTKTNCNCLPSCSSVKYPMHTYMKTFHMHTENIFTLKKQKEIEYSILKVSYGSRYVKVETMTALMRFTDFVASIGGVLSLFLGFSFLSLFELIYFLSLRIITNVWNGQKSKVDGRLSLKNRHSIRIIW